MKASYSYKELMLILGFQVEQLDLMINELIELDLIVLDGYLQITDKGKEKLKEMNLYDLDFGYLDEEEVFTEPIMSFKEIYIPEKLDIKFK